MLPILDKRVLFKNSQWVATCVCKKEVGFSSKNSCLEMLARGTCRNCRKDYRAVEGDVEIYRNRENKWCSVCSGCDKEQAYTRKDHAKQSTLADWQCRSCVVKAGSFKNNLPVGAERRLYNRFRKSANQRKVNWGIDFEEFKSCFTGKCSLTGWDISMSYLHTSASLDRIDSKKGYEVDNIQWVHTMVNMSKNKYGQDKFIEMCKAVAKYEVKRIRPNGDG